MKMPDLKMGAKSTTPLAKKDADRSAESGYQGNAKPSSPSSIQNVYNYDTEQNLALVFMNTNKV